MSKRNPRCTEADHNALRENPDEMRRLCYYAGVNDGDGWDLLELYNCPVCNSTLAVAGIGPVKEDLP